MYQGSFQDLANGTIRAADFLLRDDQGNILGIAANPLSINVASFGATVNIGNFPATQNVAIVSGELGTINVAAVTSTVNVAILSGTVNVGNFPVTQNVLSVQFGAANANVLHINSASALASTPNNVLLANAARKYWSVFNGSNKSLVIGYANTLTNSAFSFEVAMGGYYESPIGGYTGAVWALSLQAGTGNVHFTEYA